MLLSSLPDCPANQADHKLINYRLYLLSLGCAKNLVDSECMSSLIRSAGATIVNTPDIADVLIVNTCGFIESAKKEAIDAILELAEYKQPKGSARFLIVTGCLAQRYAADIYKSLPEVDRVLGTGEYDQIVSAIIDLYRNESGSETSLFSNQLPGLPGSLSHLKVEREPSNPGSYAYIKVAEGCSNCCSYCAIPGIRGSFQSRPLQDIIDEAERLSQAGRDELILIAQDTTRYGVDLYGERKLPELLRALCQIDSVRLIRILYVYADGLTDELIGLMASEPKIAHYLDLPIQHSSDRILLAMNRRDNQESLRETIARLRYAMPDIILRSTVMVGFPGESDEDFSDLVGFLSEIRFERLGCFIFSPEEGTEAAKLKPRIAKAVSKKRMQQVMKLQKRITEEANRRRIGQVVSVTLERVADDGIF
ncbi:MAG TPA: 30S ribosomal protein S12 methylthiotransferase RimO, partial [Clostridiales bacterium]|nr:30S ribosomal protein S12 methylthiotransferase RimO [Clostridiales bacterium]